MKKNSEFLDELSKCFGKIGDKKQLAKELIMKLGEYYTILPWQKKISLEDSIKNKPIVEEEIINSKDKIDIISLFYIEKIENKIAEWNSEFQIRAYMGKIKDVSNIEDYIKKHVRSHQKESYLSILRDLEMELADLESYFTRQNKKKDIEEFRDKFRDKLKKIIKDIVLEQFIDSIYKGIKADNSHSEFYTELLKVLNYYLAECGIYTAMIYSGVKRDKAVSKLVSIVDPPIYTEDPSKHNYIKEVVRLPYYIQYYSYEKAGPAEILIKGKVVCYTNKRRD